ncbi:hypothetical protein ACE6H2_027975 [Prunus campanulata]
MKSIIANAIGVLLMICATIYDLKSEFDLQSSLSKFDGTYFAFEMDKIFAHLLINNYSPIFQHLFYILLALLLLMYELSND